MRTGRSVWPARPARARSCGSAEAAGRRVLGLGPVRVGARGALTSCSAQRQMSEQRPLQQPMVPAASERRARPEIRVFRRRRLLTPEQPPTGGAHRPGPGSPAPRSPLAARRSPLWGLDSRAAFVSFRGGQRSVRRAGPERLAGVPASHCEGPLLGEGKPGGRSGAGGEGAEGRLQMVSGWKCV